MVPILDHTLPLLAEKKIQAVGYISAWKYRNSIKGVGQSEYFELAGLTKLAGKSKRLNQLLYVLSATVKILFGHTNLNVFFTQPPLFVIWGSWLSRMRGVPYYIHVQDLYPDFLGSTGHLKKESVIYRWLDRRMTASLSHANKIFVIGRCMKMLIESKIGEATLIETVINVPSISSSEKESQFLRELNLDNKFTILYAGNMGLAHEFKTILKVAEDISTTHPHVHFVFVGRGRKRGLIEDYIGKGLGNLSLLNSLDDKDFVSVLQETNMHFISMLSEFKGILVPSKFYSSLAMNKPVLYEGPVDSEIGHEIVTHGLGETVEIGGMQKMRKIILEYADSEERLLQVEENVKRYFKENCEVSKVMRGYIDILLDDIEGSSS